MYHIHVIGENSNTIKDATARLIKEVNHYPSLAIWNSSEQEETIPVYYLADYMPSMDFIKQTLDEDIQLVLPLTALQSRAHYQEIKDRANQLNARLFWINPYAINPHFQAIKQQLSKVDFGKVATNRILVKAPHQGHSLFYQDVLGLFIWLEEVFTPISRVTTLTKKSAGVEALLMSVLHAQGTLSNLQFVSTSQGSNIEIEVCGQHAMLVQKSSTANGAILYKNGKASIDSLEIRTQTRNELDFILYMLEEGTEADIIERALLVTEAAEKSSIQKKPLQLKGGSSV
ncbi:hypothetical protein [Amphibacillus cookii]|uniref:hypothetical protein n=1 Tax=Amphibacillus cookii TaxID=767787 RepID=UPI00195D35D9|nr:hypothetical protein [Amphibacillus cookii]MBM7541258.1 hypothetical protein [Amphibacillus cookii]